MGAESRFKVGDRVQGWDSVLPTKPDWHGKFGTVTSVRGYVYVQTDGEPSPEPYHPSNLRHAEPASPPADPVVAEQPKEDAKGAFLALKNSVIDKVFGGPPVVAEDPYTKHREKWPENFTRRHTDDSDERSGRRAALVANLTAEHTRAADSAGLLHPKDYWSNKLRGGRRRG